MARKNILINSGAAGIREVAENSLNSNFVELYARSGGSVLLDATLSYITEDNPNGSVSSGDILGAWEVAASGASDHHATTAGGVKLYEAGPNFSTRARAVAAHARNVASSRTIPGGTVWTWPDFSVVKMPAGHVLYGTDPISDLAGWAANGIATPVHYGAVGDESTDDTTTVQAWATVLRTVGGIGRLPAGYHFKVSTLYMHPEESYAIRGDGKDEASIVIDNSDRTAVGLKFTHTDGSTRNAGEYELDGFTVKSHTGNKACLVEHINSSAPRLHNIKLLAYTGTTALRYAQVYNGDFDDVDVWGAGHNVPFKETSGITFSITASGTTLTASASIFAAGDVGRKITLINGGTNETFTIAGYTSGTQVTVNAARVTASSVVGNFGGVRGSMTAASATLTLEADRLTSDDIGRVVYVLGAGPTVTGSSIPLRSTITAVSGTTITLDDAATATVTNAELIFDPAVDFGNTLNSYSDYTNDFSLTNLMIPQFRGTALVASGAGMNFHALKMHGNNSGVDELATNIQAMFSYFQGYLSGRFEQSVCGNLGRIVIAGGRRGWVPSFDDLEISGTYGSPMFYGMECNSGVVGLGNMKIIGDTALDLATDIHDDDGTVTFTRNGTIALYGASEYDAPTDNDTFYLDRVNGRVGVGTKFPSGNLDVRAAGIVSAQITSSGDSANFLIQAADGYVSRLWFGDATDYDVGAIEYAHTGNSMAFKTGGATRMTLSGTGLDMEGQLQFAPGSSVTPTNNGDVVFELTSNTTLTIKAKGSDGVVRSGTVTLA